MKKAVVSFLLLFGVLFSFGGSGSAAVQSQFKDVSNTYWALEEIQYLQNLKVISGYSDGRFLPGKPVTKAQAAMMINRSLKFDTKNLVNPGFSDLPATHPAYKDVAALVKAGVIPKASTFKPNDVLVRGEMAKYLVNGYKLKGTYSGQVKDVPAELLPAVKALAGNGVTAIFKDGTFKPKDSVTRAQFSAFIARALEPQYRESYSVLHLFLPSINYDMTSAEVKKQMSGYTLVDERELPAGMAVNNYYITYSAKITGLSANEQYQFYFKEGKLNIVVVNAEMYPAEKPVSSQLDQMFNASQNYFKSYVGMPKSIEVGEPNKILLYEKNGIYKGMFKETINLRVEGLDLGEEEKGERYIKYYSFIMRK